MALNLDLKNKSENKKNRMKKCIRLLKKVFFRKYQFFRVLCAYFGVKAWR